MKVTNKPGRGVFAAFLIFYGYVSFLVSIVSHVTSRQNRVILHSTFHCFLIHGCVCFLLVSPGMWRVLLCSLVFVYCAIIFVLFSALQVTIYKVYLLVNLLRSFDDFWLLYARVCGTSLWSLRQFVAKDTPRLSKVIMRTFLFLDSFIRVWPFFSLRLWITFKCQCQYIIEVFFVKIINLITIYSIFFNSLETKWGKVDFEERLCPPTFIQSAPSHR